MNSKLFSTKNFAIAILSVLILLQAVINSNILADIKFGQQEMRYLHDFHGRNALFQSPATDINAKKQYLMEASIQLPLNESTQDIVYYGNGFTQDGSYDLSISKYHIINSIAAPGEGICRTMVSVSDDKEVEEHETLRGEVQLDGKTLYVIKNNEQSCTGVFINTHLDTLVESVKQAQYHKI